MKLKHPTLSASVEVEDSEVKKWVRAGWVAPKPSVPKPVRPEPVKEPESK